MVVQKTKRPTLGRIFDTLDKRCKLSDFTNCITNASNLQERVVSNEFSKSKRQFKISEENVIRSIPTYDIVIGKRKDKAVRLFYRQKPTKENVKGEPPCVLCITVQSQNFLHTANSSHILISHISVNPTVWTVSITMFFFRNMAKLI